MTPVPTAGGVETPAAGQTPEEAAKAKWDSDAELRAEFADNFNAYMAFVKNEASGRARIKAA